MENAHGLTDNSEGDVHESLLALAEFLEFSLDKAVSVVMMRHTSDVCTVYTGDPEGPPEELRKHGTVPSGFANEMLQLTRSGPNQMKIGGQAYRFIRTFAEIGDTAAVVFSTK